MGDFIEKTFQESLGTSTKDVKTVCDRLTGSCIFSESDINNILAVLSIGDIINKLIPTLWKVGLISSSIAGLCLANFCLNWFKTKFPEAARYLEVRFDILFFTWMKLLCFLVIGSKFIISLWILENLRSDRIRMLVVLFTAAILIDIDLINTAHIIDMLKPPEKTWYSTLLEGSSQAKGFLDALPFGHFLSTYFCGKTFWAFFNYLIQLRMLGGINMPVLAPPGHPANMPVLVPFRQH